MKTSQPENRVGTFLSSPETLVEHKLDGERLFTGHIISLELDKVKLPNGETAPREVIRHRGAVAIVPLFEDGTVAVEEQYRYPIDRILLEIPAGKLDTVDEDRLSAAKRELEEETGLTADSMVCLGDYYSSPAILDERITLYLATGLHEGAFHRDSDEFLSVRRIPLSDLAEMIAAGEIPDGKTQAAILRVLYLKSKKILTCFGGFPWVTLPH